MNSFLHGMVRAVAETFPLLPEPILEIGSYQVPGQESVSNLRELFPGREYIGIDLREGPGVDMVADVEELPQADGTVGTVLAICTFEHVRRFWKGFEEIHRVLRPAGAFLVACPFYFYIHDYPSDFWRFTPSALETLLEPYPSQIVGWQGPPKRPANVWSLGFREERPAITIEEYNEYRSLMTRYARQPLKWTRRLRYEVGRLLLGPRPFVPYLHNERWDSRCTYRPPQITASRPAARTIHEMSNAL